MTDVSFYQPLLVELARASRRPAGPREDSLGHIRLFKGKRAWHIGIVIDGDYPLEAFDQEAMDQTLEYWHQQLTDLVTAIVLPEAS